MKKQMKEVAKAYHFEVSLKNEAIKDYQDLSDKMQYKIIQLVEIESMFHQLQLAFKAEIVESES